MTNVPHKERGKLPLVLQGCEELATQLNSYFCGFDRGDVNGVSVMPL